MNLVEVRDLIIGYSKSPVAHNINFKIDEGDILCILGENGAGKTTLIKTILGVIKPLGGELLLSEDIKEHRFGYLPQKSENQDDFPAIAREIVLSGCINRKKFKLFFNKEDKEIAKKNMELLGISHLADKPFNILSGGQKQRVLIARSLCATEKILFLDEPLTGLDPKIVEDFYHVVEMLHNEGITIVMISHELKTSLRLASHVLYIGEHCVYSTKDEFINSEVGKRFLE